MPPAVHAPRGAHHDPSKSVHDELVWSMLIDIATATIADELLLLTGDKADWAVLRATLKKQGDKDNSEALVMLRSLFTFRETGVASLGTGFRAR